MEYTYLSKELDDARLKMLKVKPVKSVFNKAQTGWETVPCEPYYCGGCQRYEKMTYRQYLNLKELGLIDDNEKQNNCPTVGECAEFCRTHPKFAMHGYLISPEREDCRLSVEGVITSKDEDCWLSAKDIKDVADMFCNADEIEIRNNYCRIWFD